MTTAISRPRPRTGSRRGHRNLSWPCRVGSGTGSKAAHRPSARPGRSRHNLQIEERNDLADQLALFGEFFLGLVAAERAAGHVDFALLADDDVERLLIGAGLRPVQDQLVVEEIRLNAAVLERLRRPDVVLEKFGQELGGESVPLAALAILQLTF